MALTIFTPSRFFLQSMVNGNLKPTNTFVCEIFKTFTDDTNQLIERNLRSDLDGSTQPGITTLLTGVQFTLNSTTKKIEFRSNPIVFGNLGTSETPVLFKSAWVYMLGGNAETGVNPICFCAHVQTELSLSNDDLILSPAANGWLTIG